jgi:HK97 family phage prohead protease
MTARPNTRDIANQPILRLAPPLEVKLADDRKGLIEGIASPYGGEPDLYGDVIAKGAYAATIAEHEAAGVTPAMLWSHDLAHPVGRWLELREDDRGLYVRGQMNLESERGREAFAHLRARDVTGLSIGFRIPDGGYQYRSDGFRLITSVDLVEISVVAVPAARRARVTEVKSIDDLQDQRDLERLLHEDAGLSRRAAKAVAARGWSGLSGEDDERAAVEILRRMDKAIEEVRSIGETPYRYR